jgi:hypothetical protein
MWNPYLLCGCPAIADGVVGFFYPFRVLLLGLTASQTFLFGALCRTFLAGLFMYLFLRRLHLGEKSSLFGAICFMFSGFFIIWNGYPTFVESAFWLPLMFLMVENIITKGDWRYFLLLALITSISILAGLFQMTLYHMYATGLYMFWRAVSQRRRLGTSRLPFLFTGFGLSMVLALMISAVQLLPFYELASNSHRYKVNLEKEFFPTVCPPEFAIQYLMPEFFGSPIENDFWFVGMAQHINEDLRKNSAWSSNLVELNGYTGVVVLLLAFLGLASTKKNLSFFFILLIILSRLPVFSKTALSFYYYVIPGFQTSVPHRLSFIYMFSLICLAALGLEEAVSRAEEEKVKKNLLRLSKACFYLAALSIAFLIVINYFRKFDTNYLSTFFANDNSLPGRLNAYYISILAAGYFWSHTLRTVLIFIGLTGAIGLILILYRQRNITPTMFVYIMGLVFVAEMSYFQHRICPLQKPNLYFKTGSIQFLQENLGHARIARCGDFGILPFDTALYYGLRDSQGYTPFIIDRESDFLQSVEERCVLHERWAAPFRNPKSLENPMFALLSVKYVLTDLKTHLNERRFKPVFEDGIRIYEYSDYIPRAFVVHQYQVVPSKDSVLRKLKENAANLRETVLLEEIPDEDLSVPAPIRDESVEFSSDGPNEVKLKVVTPTDGFLVLNDTFYPGWKSSVDGVEQRIYRANYMFRAVFVPAGNHEVTFHYRPASLFVGASISSISLLALLLGLLILRPRHYCQEDGTETPAVSRQEALQ